MRTNAADAVDVHVHGLAYFICECIEQIREMKEMASKQAKEMMEKPSKYLQYAGNVERELLKTGRLALLKIR